MNFRLFCLLGIEIEDIRLEKFCTITFGVPVVFGPNYFKFNEAVELINANGAISISNYNSLVNAFKKLEQINSEILFNYIQQNSGATSKLIEEI